MHSHPIAIAVILVLAVAWLVKIIWRKTSYRRYRKSDAFYQNPFNVPIMTPEEKKKWMARTYQKLLKRRAARLGVPLDEVKKEFE